MMSTHKTMQNHIKAVGAFADRREAKDFQRTPAHSPLRLQPREGSLEGHLPHQPHGLSQQRGLLGLLHLNKPMSTDTNAMLPPEALIARGEANTSSLGACCFSSLSTLQGGTLQTMKDDSRALLAWGDCRDQYPSRRTCAAFCLLTVPWLMGASCGARRDPSHCFHGTMFGTALFGAREHSSFRKAPARAFCLLVVQ